jgi:O-antigen/teichoic acid export membrane protein
MAKNFINTKVVRASNYLGIDLPYFLTGGLWLTLSTITLLIGGIFLSALFARVLTKEVFGQYSFLMSILGFASLTALPGMGQAVRQAVAEKKDGFFISAILATAKWSLAGSVVLVFISIYYFFNNNLNLSIAIFLSAIVFPITSAGSLFTAFLSGKKNFRLASIYGTIAQFASIGATAFALWKFPNLVTIAIFSAWSTALISVVLTFLALRYAKNRKTDNNLLKLGYHLSFSQFFTISADYLDRFLVPIILGFTNNAIYSFAILIPMQIHGFLKSFTILGQPKVAELSTKNIKRSLAVKSIQFEILVAFFVLLYIITAPKIFLILYPNYQGYAVVLSQLFSLSLLYYPGNILALLFVRERKAKTIYQMNIIYALSSVVLLIFLVPTFGLVGAVVAKIGVRFLQLVTQIGLFVNLKVKEN